MTGTRVEIKHYLSGYQHETSRLFCHKAAKFRLRDAMSELALRDAPVTVVKPDLDQKPHVALF
jgi:hypothetical protein